MTRRPTRRSAAAVADAKSGGFTWKHMDAVKMADPRIDLGSLLDLEGQDGARTG